MRGDDANSVLLTSVKGSAPLAKWKQLQGLIFFRRFNMFYRVNGLKKKGCDHRSSSESHRRFFSLHMLID